MSINFMALSVKTGKSIGSPGWEKLNARFVLTGLLFVVLFGCSPKAPTEAIQATISITKIVDRATQRPINSNFVTLRWETPEGKVIRTEQYRNQSQLTTTMPADGSVRLFVIIEAPG